MVVVQEPLHFLSIELVVTLFLSLLRLRVRRGIRRWFRQETVTLVHSVQFLRCKQALESFGVDAPGCLETCLDNRCLIATLEGLLDIDLERATVGQEVLDKGL